MRFFKREELKASEPIAAPQTSISSWLFFMIKLSILFRLWTDNSSNLSLLSPKLDYAHDTVRFPMLYTDCPRCFQRLHHNTNSVSTSAEVTESDSGAWVSNTTKAGYFRTHKEKIIEAAAREIRCASCHSRAIFLTLVRLYFGLPLLGQAFGLPLIGWDVKNSSILIVPAQRARRGFKGLLAFHVCLLLQSAWLLHCVFL